MEILKSHNGYTLQFNGSKTFMVIDSANQCVFATSSRKKAIAFFERLMKQVN